MSQIIPKVQKAVVVTKTGQNPQVRIDDNFPVPEPKENELLIRLTSSGVCHSDLSFLQSDWNNVPMLAKVAGHEGSGYVVQQGPGVNRAQFPIGYKVGVPLISNPCRYCHNCSLPEGEVYCSNSPFNGCFKDGTWQQYMVISTSYVIPVPEVPDNFYVGPILCGGVTVYKALKNSRARAGEWVVITGAGGGLGSMGVQYASALGLRIIAIDTGNDKKELALSLGAEYFIDYEKQDVVSDILLCTEGLGTNAAIMIAPVESSYNQALEYLGTQGTLVCVGLPKSGKYLKFEPTSLIMTGKIVVGSMVGTRSDIIESLDFVKRGKVVPPVVVRPMEDIQQIIDEMIKGEILGRVVIDLA